jgi:hypothetical protein
LIKRGSQAIEKITKDESNIVRNIFNLHSNDVPSIVGIILSEEFAGFFAKAGESFPEVFKMFLRPGRFEIGIEKRNESGTHNSHE